LNRLIAHKMSPFRIGHGYDIHRLQPGGRLVLGGVVVAHDISPIAHSDGDVVIHALADALLGALGLGDIGEHFPDTDPRFRGVASVTFLEKIREEHLRSAALVAVHCDVTIMAERPRLAPFKKQMREFLRNAIGCDVNIKAGTNEGCGEIGRGEAIAAHAVVLLAPSSQAGG
jgi:2-C-methyl-D-erythritol 2,4-cyclodiphosphate synthase